MKIAPEFVLRGVVIAVGLVVSSRAAFADGSSNAWPATVEGHIAPHSGEHPRLLFRRNDLPALRQRAATPEGRAIVTRLRRLLNGSDGMSLPTAFNPEVGPVASDGAGAFHRNAPLGAYTFSHMAGYGLLYQLPASFGVRVRELAVRHRGKKSRERAAAELSRYPLELFGVSQPLAG